MNDPEASMLVLDPSPVPGVEVAEIRGDRGKDPERVRSELPEQDGHRRLFVKLHASGTDPHAHGPDPVLHSGSLPQLRQDLVHVCEQRVGHVHEAKTGRRRHGDQLLNAGLSDLAPVTR